MTSCACDRLISIRHTKKPRQKGERLGLRHSIWFSHPEVSATAHVVSQGEIRDTRLESAQAVAFSGPRDEYEVFAQSTRRDSAMFETEHQIRQGRKLTTSCAYEYRIASDSDVKLQLLLGPWNPDFSSPETQGSDSSRR